MIYASTAKKTKAANTKMATSSMYYTGQQNIILCIKQLICKYLCLPPIKCEDICQPQRWLSG